MTRWINRTSTIEVNTPEEQVHYNVEGALDVARRERPRFLISDPEGGDVSNGWLRESISHFSVILDFHPVEVDWFYRNKAGDCFSVQLSRHAKDLHDEISEAGYDIVGHTKLTEFEKSDIDQSLGQSYQKDLKNSR